METSKEITMMHHCQKAKDAVKKNKKKYLDFVAKGLNNRHIENAAASLLPFDNVICARLRFVDDASQVKSMGFYVMRMDLTPATYSLGISIEICEGDYNSSANPTIFLTAFKPLEQLKEYVKGQIFSSMVSDYFESEIDKSFFLKVNN